MYKRFIIIFIISISSLIGEEIFNLKDGSSIRGDRIFEDEASITVKTSFGEVIINKNDIVIKEYIVILKSGETLIGSKKEDNNEYIVLKTQKIGNIKLNKNEISSIQEINIDNTKEEDTNNGNRRYRGGILGLISGTGIVDNVFSDDKDSDFTEGQEQLISIFSDPTAHTLTRSTLYMSGLSFGVGLTDNMQITTRWSSFFYGDLNLRFKYKAYSSGNWKKQSALAFGVDYHQRWWPDKYEWVSGSLVKDSETYYYGGWRPLNSSAITADNIHIDEWCIENGEQNCAHIDDDGDDPDDLDYMVELFGAYTFSKARLNLKGQITHTFGARVFIPRTQDGTKWEFLPRLYYGVDFDITPRFKIITAIIYDKYMLEPYQGGFFGNDLELSTSPIDSSDVLPVHLDFGFVYAFNNNFRFGIHFQQPWLGFYWKF